MQGIARGRLAEERKAWRKGARRAPRVPCAKGAAWHTRAAVPRARARASTRRSKAKACRCTALRPRLSLRTLCGAVRLLCALSKRLTWRCGHAQTTRSALSRARSRCQTAASTSSSGPVAFPARKARTPHPALSSACSLPPSHWPHTRTRTYARAQLTRAPQSTLTDAARPRLHPKRRHQVGERPLPRDARVQRRLPLKVPQSLLPSRLLPCVHAPGCVRTCHVVRLPPSAARLRVACASAPPGARP